MKLQNSKEQYLGKPKYEFSFCNKCNLVHSNVENGICKLCQDKIS